MVPEVEMSYLAGEWERLLLTDDCVLGCRFSWKSTRIGVREFLTWEGHSRKLSLDL